MIKTYSYQDLVNEVREEKKLRLKAVKDKKKHMRIGMVIMIVPAMILGIVVLAYLLRNADDHKYIVEIRPYQELTSPYRPYPVYLGQDLPQMWEVHIVKGKQVGTAEFQEFRLFEFPDSLKVTLDEYKQILIDNDVYRAYAWGGKIQKRKK